MSDSTIYDDAAYHQGAPAFSSKHLNPQNGGTHIGMYLAWIIVNRLESYQLRVTAADAVEEVRRKRLTGRDFLFAHCQGRLTSDALNKEAQAFTEAYYENEFLVDFEQVLVSASSGTYRVADSWPNFESLAKVMDERLRRYRGRTTSVKPASAAK